MKHLRRNSGFTLIELMIVVVIIGILAAIAIPRFGGVSRSAKQAEAESVLKQIHTLQEAHFQKYNQYASNIDPATAESATNLGGWENPNAKFYNFAAASGNTTSYCANATLTTEGTNAGVQPMSIRVANRAALTATDGKPQVGACAAGGGGGGGGGTTS
jgi:prepilin-type N-terminal cleavage/methylation domain-containing protein